MLKKINTSTNRIVIAVLTILLICVIILNASGCGYNKQIIDTKYAYNKAYITNVGEVQIKSWNEYSEPDMIQVITTDGTVYYTSPVNIILIAD